MSALLVIVFITIISYHLYKGIYNYLPGTVHVPTAYKCWHFSIVTIYAT